MPEEELFLSGSLADEPFALPRNWVAVANKPQSQVELEALRVSVAKEGMGSHCVGRDGRGRRLDSDWVWLIQSVWLSEILTVRCRGLERYDLCLGVWG